MYSMIPDLVWVFGALVLGVLFGALTVAKKAPAPKHNPYLCSCTHGYHSGDCQKRITSDRYKDEWVGGRTTGKYMRRWWNEVSPCGCEVFDGAIPPSLIGREYMNLPQKKKEEDNG